MTAQAFDLTERLQTPVIVMTDLDLGMNDHVSDPLEWDDSYQYDRGKVLTYEQLNAIYAETRTSSPANGSGDAALAEDRFNADTDVGVRAFDGKWGRYLDIDGDGIPYRTIAGTHPTRGAFVTRGSSRDEYGVYTEDGDAYKRNVERLAKKWKTAEELVPQPEFLQDRSTRPDGVIFFGTSTYAAEEAIDLLKDDGIVLDAMRPRAFPFGKAFRDFIVSHGRVFVIEQNRDAQFRSLIMIELGTEASKLISVLNYDGMPITADNIYRQIVSHYDR
jgi:2-oxoglutarate ferredoxin oxidoreductase subunit alpha